MLLAGVVMKLGAYGCLRVAMMLFPRGLDPWGFHLLGLGSWRDVFALLALIGIVYGAQRRAGAAGLQVRHRLFQRQPHGLRAARPDDAEPDRPRRRGLPDVSHGVIAGLLFAVVGRMVYDRTHTRDLDELGPMHLTRAIPFAAVIFILAAMASIGLPGFSGFIAEFQVLIGVWRSLPWMPAIAGFGILVGVAFTWRALTKAFFGEGPVTRRRTPAPPITWPERLGAFLLLGTTLAGRFTASAVTPSSVGLRSSSAELIASTRALIASSRGAGS